MSTKPSILHVTSYFPPDRIGGVGEVALLLHRALIDQGYRSKVLTSGVTPSDGLVCRVGRNPWAFFLRSWTAFRMAREFDVVQFHHGEALFLMALLRARHRRPSILLMLHVDVRRREAANRPHTVRGRLFGASGIRETSRRTTGRFKALLDRLAWRLADQVVVETECLRRELSDLRPFREVTVVPYGLPARPDVGPSADPVELLYVGTAGMRKRTHLLPLILHRVQLAIPDARLRVVGFSRERDEQLATVASDLGVEGDIEFVGPLESPAVQPYYRSARVLVLPSIYEGLPMVMLEAMRAGLPVVATDVSGHPEAISDGIDGYLVPPDDVDAMAQRCIELLENPEKASRFSAQARKVVADRFGSSRQLDSFIRLYGELL